jgi:hypothetical protein
VYRHFAHRNVCRYIKVPSVSKYPRLRGGEATIMLGTRQMKDACYEAEAERRQE